MADSPNKPLPDFQSFATVRRFLTDAEMDQLIADHAALLADGKLGAGAANSDVRRSQVAFLGIEPKYHWLYERVWVMAQECNQRFFCVDIGGVEPNIQLARYDSSGLGFYNWHTDFAGYRPLRKLSISVQLSRPEDYDGGDLELFDSVSPNSVDKTRGTFVVFPSFKLHRVAPVTRGTRWSLVAWVLGDRWR
jgi:predicted 2-oxoglutarate/Fe(II)-dependent dioxygenase YbiX